MLILRTWRLIQDLEAHPGSLRLTQRPWKLSLGLRRLIIGPWEGPTIEPGMETYPGVV
jgi:hypothetical protein